MKKVLLLTDKPFAQVAIDGIQKVASEAGYEDLSNDEQTESR